MAYNRESRVGFKDVRRAVIAALRSGRYQHVARDAIDVKNLLATGQVDVGEIVDVIRRCDGTHYRCSPHHQIRDIDCHVIRIEGWYIKFYFLDPNTVFISVHH